MTHVATPFRGVITRDGSDVNHGMPSVFYHCLDDINVKRPGNQLKIYNTPVSA